MPAPRARAKAPRGAPVVATCHCGAVRLHVRAAPRTVTRCNCSLCRRYGAQWAYYAASSVRVEAPPGGLERYSWRHRVRAYYRCRRCGCVTHYRYRRAWGRGTVAVNATQFEPEALAHTRVREFDGAASRRSRIARGGPFPRFAPRRRA
ncbi:MAG: GFA family protein [Proteobacteria bacterium]|nr:GFA family protein [Pseudomonadota bacterium]